jgi:hypothetical protein
MVGAGVSSEIIEQIRIKFSVISGLRVNGTKIGFSFAPLILHNPDQSPSLL